jgi:pimeloyl-ACP methyl ester carboxylesterase
MVLLHGVTDTPRTWDLVRDALAAQHELLEPTLLGHSGGPAYTDDPSPAAIADQVERDMDAAGLDKAHLVGNSLGGGIALMLAARGRATTVVGLAPAGGQPTDDQHRHHVLSFFRMAQNLVKEAAPRAEEIASTPAGRQRALAFMVEHHEHVPADLVAHQIRSAAECPIVLPMIEHTIEHGYDEFASIDVPVRIVWGREDKVLPYPSAAARFRELIPDADWVVLDDIGHLPQLDDPARTAELILEFTRPDPSSIVDESAS